MYLPLKTVFTLFLATLLSHQGFSATEGDVSNKPTAQQAWLGIYVKPLPESLRAQLGIGKSVGLLVEDVVAGSPADQADLKPFDVLISFDDQKLINRDQLLGLILDSKPNSEVKFQIIRTGKPMTLPVTLGGKSLKTREKTSWENFEMSDDIREMLESLTENPEIKSALSEAKGEIAELIRSVSESLPTEEEIKENITEALQSISEDREIISEVEIIVKDEQEPNPVMRRSRILSGATEVNYSDRHGDILVKSNKEDKTVRILNRDHKVIYEGPLTEKVMQSLERRDRERLENLLKMHAIEVAQAE